MTKAHAKEQMADVENLLTLPDNAGRAIVQSGAVIVCPLLGTDRFVKFCIERGLSINRDRLIRLERLGLFAPIFRVRTPNEDTQPFYIPVRESNWFTKRWAWDTTGIPSRYEVPDHKDQTQEGYYSIFQIDYLQFILKQLTLQLQLDGFLDHTEGESIDWQKSGDQWMQHAEHILMSLRTHEYRRCVALLCQYISNRYYPQTQGDQRTIQVPQSYSSSDVWISVYAHDWNWYEELRSWNPHTVECLFDLTPKKLRHAYEGLALSQEHCDPLKHWYQLTQFVSVHERTKLKGDALLAETLRAGAHMLRLLYKDLYGEELPHPNEVFGMIRNHIPELAIRQDARHYLEFVVNRFGLNPRPKLSLIVEGQSEEIVIRKIFEEYFGAHLGKYGIEIIVLGGVDVATGTKKDDRFRAILRLVDYLHHHQTITFLILDNENYAGKLKQEARKAKSIHSNRRYVTRPEYIRIWKDSFEFDNFSCSEIAAAMNELAQGRTKFSCAAVAVCKSDGNPGARLEELYRRQSNYDLPKLRLNEILVKHMMSAHTRRKIESRPIFKALERVARLADRNPFPTTHEIWKTNQASKHLGMKRKPARQLNATLSCIKTRNYT